MIDFSRIRGFNYQPSRGSTSLENWENFDSALWRRELGKGKEYFPRMNTVRLWLSWDAYFRKPEEFKANFAQALDIAGGLGLQVVPCLFNRWHDPNGYDNGGVYIENILFKQSWCYFRPHYRQFAADMAATFRDDERILFWDLCNEPFTSVWFTPENAQWIEGEREWLAELYETVKERDPSTPASVSPHPDPACQPLLEPISDVLLCHPYFSCSEDKVRDPELRAGFEASVRSLAEFARQSGKPLVATETCWGALHDDVRAEFIRYTLEILTQYSIGIIAHALYYSRVADLHDPEDGFVGLPGNLAFINKDGSLRAGHEVFNAFCP